MGESLYYHYFLVSEMIKIELQMAFSSNSQNTHVASGLLTPSCVKVSTPLFLRTADVSGGRCVLIK